MYGTASTPPTMPDYRYGSFNLSTGAFTAITGSSDNTYGSMVLAYDGTTLFGLIKSTLYTLDPSTGSYTTLRSVTVPPYYNWTAMSTIPVAVPEPSTYALAAIATGVMAAIARRRKAARA